MLAGLINAYKEESFIENNLFEIALIDSLLNSLQISYNSTMLEHTQYYCRPHKKTYFTKNL